MFIIWQKQEQFHSFHVTGYISELLFIDNINAYLVSTILKNLQNCGNCDEELPKKPVGQLSAVCWPTVDGRLLADCRPSVCRLWADCRPFVGRQMADRRPTGFPQNIDYQSADKRPTVGRQLVMCR